MDTARQTMGEIPPLLGKPLTGWRVALDSGQVEFLLELLGEWLARAYAWYGILLIAVPAVLLLHSAVLVPDRIDVIGTDDAPFLNRALDISVGLAQIKPRTAQTASVLATGRTPDELPRPASFGYRDIEPLGGMWTGPAVVRVSRSSPIPVPAPRRAVAGALLDPAANLEMCALILALYQAQWEDANPAWSLRGKPEILATLFQIGFARSRPHGAPESNAFGARVREIYGQPWLAAIF